MRRMGHIYFIRCGEYVKIGFSTDHQSRIRAISAHTPYEVVLEALHEGTRADEATFHRLLASHRHKLEWFCWCADVRDIALRGLSADDRTPILARTTLDEARSKVGGSTGLARAMGGHNPSGGIPVEAGAGRAGVGRGTGHRRFAASTPTGFVPDRPAGAPGMILVLKFAVEWLAVFIDAISASINTSNVSSRMSIRVPASAALRASLFASSIS